MAKSVFLRDFLQSARNVRNSGGATPERSFYAALSVLLNSIGDALKPKVTVVMEMKNQGAGNPDGGLYTEEQFDRKTLKLKDAQSPNRGVIEVKSPAEPVGDISKTTQIEKILASISPRARHQSARLAIDRRARPRRSRLGFLQ